MEYSVLSTQYSGPCDPDSVLSTQYSVLGTQYSVLRTPFFVSASSLRGAPPCSSCIPSPLPRTMMFLIIFLLVNAFILGTIVGSLLNVCIYRLPLEKSILWPGSRCSHCLQPIRWYVNIPLVSYLW